MKRPAAASSECMLSYSMNSRVANEGRWQVTQSTTAQMEEYTPYGEMRKEFEVPRHTGGNLTIEYCCPFAWLHTVLSLHEKLYNMLMQCATGGRGKLCFYADETKPGNVLRPELARSFTCVYWCIANLPDWFRAKLCAWNVICIIPSVVMKQIKGGLSMVYDRVPDIFWSEEGWNFSRLGLVARDTHFKFEYGFFCVDEKAEKEILGITGACGTRMCVSCVNCVRLRQEQIQGTCLTHFTEQDMSKFSKQTSAMLEATHAQLEAASTELSASAFKLLESSLGMKYKQCVVLRGVHKRMLDMPASRYSDWFHNLYASGGIFQYSINQVVLDMLDAGYSCDDIERIQTHVVEHAGATRLRATFFEDRVVRDRGAHIKAFASEVMSAITVVDFVLDTLAEPTLRKQRRLFALMREITDLLNAGDSAVAHAAYIDELLSEHNRLFLRMYPQCAKPKHHLCRHTKDALLYHKVNVSCNACERLHRRSKALALHAYRKFENTLLRRLVALQAGDLACEDRFVFASLTGSEKEYFLRGGKIQVFTSTKICTRTLPEGCIVAWVRDERLCVVKVYGGALVGNIPHLLVGELQQQNGSAFSTGVVGVTLMPHTSVIRTPPYAYLTPTSLRVLLPLRCV